mgnify:CR=1 FL=1
MRKVLFMVLLGLLFLTGCTSNDKLVSIVVDEYVGEVSFNGETASPGTVFTNKLSIQTGPGSYCDLIFIEKNILRVFSDSKLDIDLSEAEKSVTLEIGGVGFVMGEPIGDEKDPFEVETQVAVAAVRGTVFDMVMEESNQIYVCTCNGEIHHQAGESFEETISASHHNSYRIRKESDGSLTEMESGMEYHDDTVMDFLATKVGLEIDWTLTNGVSEIDE